MYDGTHDATGSDTQIDHETLVRMGIARKVYEVRDAVRAISTLLTNGRELTHEQQRRLTLAAKEIEKLLSHDSRSAA